MEYVDGVNLHRLVQQQGPLPLAQANDYVRQAALDTPPGFGIGLAVVRETVSDHRGVVTVYSEGRGRGSEFVVRLPIALSSHSAA